MAHGMFPRGGGDLVHHFVKECNAQLAEKLAREVQEETAEEEQGGKRFVYNLIDGNLHINLNINFWFYPYSIDVFPALYTQFFPELCEKKSQAHYALGF